MELCEETGCRLVVDFPEAGEDGGRSGRQEGAGQARGPLADRQTARRRATGRENDETGRAKLHAVDLRGVDESGAVLSAVSSQHEHRHIRLIRVDQRMAGKVDDLRSLRYEVEETFPRGLTAGQET